MLDEIQISSELDEIIEQSNIEARDYQKRIVQTAIDNYTREDDPAKSVMIESPTGCLSGDTEVVFNVNGKSIRRTLKEAFVRFHGGDPDAKNGECYCGCEQQTKVPTKTDLSKGQQAGVPLKFIHTHQGKAQRWSNQVYVRASKGEKGIGLQPITNIVRSGIKEVFTLVVTNDNGQTKQLTGTSCHLIATNNGWIPIGKLEKNMKVMCDRVSVTKSAHKKQKSRDAHINNLWNHPFGRKVHTKKESRGYTIRIPKHIAVWEAASNNLTLEQYIDIMKHGDPKNMFLVDPSIFVIHHKDGDHYNNDYRNLQLLTIEEHNRLHGEKDGYKNFGNARQEWWSVQSVTEAGRQMTYDICCKQPYHNFSANGIIVHNSGKTCMALLTAKMLQDKYDIGIAWIAMRRNLLAQAARENQDLGINADIEFVSMFSNDPPKYDSKGRKIELMVVDEAQHDAASSMATLHNFMKPRFVLGMTATPFRTDKMKLCFDKVIRDIGIHQLIQYGYLSKYNLYTIPKYDPESVANTYLREPAKWGKSVMFFLKTEEAEECVQTLREAGVKAEIILGNMSASSRERLLARFDKGQIDVLVNLFILTEGFDCPSLQTVFVRDSQKGPTTQMAGRVFRKFPNIKFKQVVQSKETKWAVLKTAIPEDSYVWNPELNRWRSVKPHKGISRIVSRSIVMNARTNVILPEFIMKRKPAERRFRG